jgi:hypothetical protein
LTIHNTPLIVIRAEAGNQFFNVATTSKLVSLLALQ